MNKKLMIVSLILIVLFFNQMRAQSDVKEKEIEQYELNQNEVIAFFNDSNIRTSDYKCTFKRNSYDNTRYSVEINGTGNLKVSDISECNGNHQNEIELFNSSGTITRNSDTIKIYAKTIYNKFYLFNVKKNGMNESFAPEIRIELISKTLNNENCPNLVTLNEDKLHITAFPKNIDKDEIYEPYHLDKTIGIFTRFAVYDSSGKTEFFPAGDYIIIGGNSLKISK